MINKFKPHLLILPEDEANRMIANGFVQTPHLDLSRVQILPNAGGWGHVRDSFTQAHNKAMSKYDKRMMLLLVDFDNQDNRREEVLSQVSPQVRDRVFVLGTLSEPEDLRGDLGHFERIGEAIGDDCLDEAPRTWEHPLLQHNEEELRRLTERVRPFLFPTR